MTKPFSPAATLTTCPNRSCKNTEGRGALCRTGDGADRLSEATAGRIVVQCMSCGDRYSLDATVLQQNQGT
jgi:hypothetical protein